MKEIQREPSQSASKIPTPRVFSFDWKFSNHFESRGAVCGAESGAKEDRKVKAFFASKMRSNQRRELEVEVIGSSASLPQGSQLTRP